jgi:hypothetical protein
VTKQAFKQAMDRLTANYGRTLDKLTIDTYAAGLRGLTDGQLEHAVDRALLELPMWPSSAQLRTLGGARAAASEEIAVRGQQALVDGRRGGYADGDAWWARMVREAAGERVHPVLYAYQRRDEGADGPGSAPVPHPRPETSFRELLAQYGVTMPAAAK